MSEHVKRGMEIQKNRTTDTDWKGIDDDRINSEWQCEKCGGRIVAKQRRGRDAYVSLECDCALVSVDVRLAGVFDLDIPEWDTEAVTGE
jgi:DNA-directed RNA polymerase subunit RPC12/RpoP